MNSRPLASSFLVFSKKDREISFEISLKIRENKGRISTKFTLITFAQYCTCIPLLIPCLSTISLFNFYMRLRNERVIAVCGGKCQEILHVKPIRLRQGATKFQNNNWFYMK